MKHTAKRSLSFVLCLLLVVGILPFGVWATDIETPPDDPVDPDPYTYVAMIYAGLKVEGEVAKCNCGTSLHLSYWEYPITLTMKLQRSSNGTDWTTVNSWSVNSYCDADMTRRWAVYTNYSYRVYAVVEVKNSDFEIIETADITVYQ